jgi:hypothetical protein
VAKKISIFGMIALLVLGGLLAGGYWLVQRRERTVCGFCHRNINPRSAVIAEVGGRQRRVCCAHCAITEGRQENKPVRLISVTDYSSGKQMAPADAWYVDGSRMIACEHDLTHMDEMKHANQLAYDRCAPGTFAFARREDALDFVINNGGVLRRLPELLESLGASAPAPAREAHP